MPQSRSTGERSLTASSAAETSPSVIRRMRAPASRTSRIASSWRGRSSMTTVTSPTLAALALGDQLAASPAAAGRGRAGRRSPRRRPSFPCRRRGRGRTSCRARRARSPRGRWACRGRRGVVPSSGSTAMSTTRRAAVADLLAVEEHRRLVLLALADHDDAVHRDRVEHEAHRVDGGAVGGDLVAAADPAGGGERRRLGDADQLQREVAVGLRLRGSRAIGGAGYRVARVAALGTDAAAAGDAAGRSRGAREARRGGRLHRPLERRDQRARRLHAAGAERRLDRAGAARDRDRRRLPARPGAARPGGGGARRRLRRALRARHRLLLGPDRRRLERDPLREAAEQGARDARLPAHGARPASAPRAASSSRRRPAAAGADRARGAARQDARARGRARPTAPSPTSCRSAGCRRWPRQLEGAPEGFELLCRFFCLPGEREAVEPLARFMFSSYITVPVYAAFYRWLGYGEQIDADGRGLGRRRPPGRRGGGALGADRGDVHLRLARSR